ncbi:MAG: hypothetical protein P3W97_010365 [Tepidimonas sp.]|uniref:hypothetical protein n=1 Tax=Tepidimonas sp. TaxID=2002775 RepID=UPI00259DA2D9|nr:hypothetical protein [Tepidimonas sp.]MDM7457630.1 hypothetical protein [Tepidimonas sp.]
MSRVLSVLAGVAALAGCAAPTVPAWRIEASHAVEQAVASTLAGRTRAAQQQWRSAQAAAASAGRADALARVALARCAVEQAALARDASCAAAQPYLADAGPAERAYAAYLALAQAGETASAPAETVINDLPSPHQAIARALHDGAAPAELARLLAAMDDPLARLVAGGLLWHAQRLDAAGVSLMVETASQQGWRRPLAVWLGVQVRLAEAAGDPEGAARAQRRLDWVLGADATGAR